VTTPPSHWPDKALSLALTVLTIAMSLYVAARLIVAVWPVLAIVGAVIFVMFAGWSIYQFRKSRW
jgi:NADH:ubiquinone oxidoreductase subunit 6 (subunit J)